MPTPAEDANEHAEYLTALMERGIDPDVAIRMTVAWILSRGPKAAIEDALEKLSEPEPKESWEG